MKKPKRGKPVSKAPQRAFDKKAGKLLSAVAGALHAAQKGTPGQKKAALTVLVDQAKRFKTP